jgi:hypothetical protein
MCILISDLLAVAQLSLADHADVADDATELRYKHACSKRKRELFNYLFCCGPVIYRPPISLDLLPFLYPGRLQWRPVHSGCGGRRIPRLEIKYK